MMIAQAIKLSIGPFTREELTILGKANLSFFALALLFPFGKFKGGKYKLSPFKSGRFSFKNGKFINNKTGKVVTKPNTKFKGAKIKNNPNGKTKVDGAKVPKISTLTEAEKLKLANQYKKKSPMNIPENAKINAQSKNRYEQISFKWKENGETIEVRCMT
ncbi:hypothetical protein [uncultured Vagococcus sp.]|uniref:hypothetical protein n=1 Tax=uncultured Vagococcus sp. TaxID=189676 RepID=UPI0028D2B074|nr:hypothetical protein [uncultured Vagococcus sp.]